MNFNKPRVAIYYHVLPSTGMRNDGCPLYINYNLRKILNGVPDMGSDNGNVVHLWPNKTAEKYGKFDLHVWCDYGEDALDLNLDWSPPSPSAYWCSDAHISEESYQYRLSRAKRFDYVFCCQKEAMERFENDGIPRERLFFMPHAAEPDVYKPYDIIKKWDWCFIGHMNSNERIDLVDRFCREWPVGIKGYLGWRRGEVPGYNVFDDVAKKFSMSRIVLNNAIRNDINMRCFESLACKSFLMTSDIPTLGDVLTPGVHLVTYKTVDEAVEKAKYYLAHEEEREAIASAGYKEVISNHTYMNRALDILKLCLNYTP